MRWAGHVARMGDRKGAYRVLVGKPERDHLEDLRVDRGIILKLIFKKWDGGTDWIDPAQDWAGDGHLECLCFIKCTEFLDYLRTG